jgi:hypothetical protein
MQIEESASDFIPNEEENKEETPINGYPNEGQEQSKKGSKIIEMLKKETGEGSIASYEHHPLNRNGDNNISQIIRGCTGMLGNLNFAILDIVLGSMGFVKDKQNNVNDVEYKEVKKTHNPVKGPTIVNGQNV